MSSELLHPTVTPGQGRRQREQRWRRGSKITWGCWNAQTLHSYVEVTNQGTLNIKGKDPTKIDALCDELSTRKVSLCAISEHRWKGEGTYQVNQDWQFVFSGIPENSEKAMYGAGVLLNREMTRAWRDADNFCEFGGGRLLRLRLKLRGRFFSVVSCYAPTFRCADAEKEKFYEDLGSMMDKVCPRDELILLGDFNARVGVADAELEAGSGTPTVREMVGNYGLPERNENGVRLLDFCSSRRENLKIASTFYQHNAYGTWIHQASKRWFQIDHVLCSRQTKALITDVKVMPGYTHNTDHRFLKVQFAVPPRAMLGKFYRTVDGGMRDARVSRLQVEGLKTQVVVDDMNLQLHSLMAEGFFDEGYELFGYAVRKVASKCLGEVSRDPLPEWKKTNADRLAELSLQKREAARGSPLGCQSKEYKQARRTAKKEVRRILNSWWASKAESIQAQVDAKDHNHQFAGYRELRRVLASSRRAPGKLRDAQGELIFTLSGRVSRWREYFDELLNVPASAQQMQLDKVSEVPRAAALDEVPSLCETVAALGRLTTGRASGPDGIEAEILMALDPVNIRALHEFFVRIWMEFEPMPHIWKDAYLAPLPKRGDLSFCKRWRGILLASILEKCSQGLLMHV